ncbi:MAG TPA: dienelactone hydrolase family protein [Pseudonocardiaceae bacterium]
MPATTIPGAASAPELRAHLAVPPVGAGPWPGVVVLHEVFGLTDDIRQQADRLAAAGYLAVAPDLFTAGGALRCLRSTFAALISGQGRAWADIDATRGWLAGRADCTGAVGVIGFCLGGGFALLAATRGFDVSAPNYGLVPKHAETVLRGACPVVASYGRRDRGMRGAAQQLDRVLTGLGVAHDVKEYPDAGHSFLNRHNSGPFSVLERVAGLNYHEPSAEDAWARILRFFHHHLRDAEDTGYETG